MILSYWILNSDAFMYTFTVAAGEGGVNLNYFRWLINNNRSYSSYTSYSKQDKSVKSNQVLNKINAVSYIGIQHM